MMKIIRLICAALIAITVAAGNAGAQEQFSPELLAKRLEWFQNMKFGFMAHWGPYSQWGVVESWGLSLDLPQIRTENWGSDINVYRNAYWKLNQTFYPMEFDPFAWAGAAKEAGMKYFIFTTKHHDGFNMYDTKLTDYSVTGPECPYSKHPQPDITALLFDAFRREGFAIGAYYSKADWHSPFYWKPDSPAPDRNVNYSVAEEPERWQRFQDFVHGQIEELVTGYGKIDILWLDAGWVRKERNGQDLDMPRLARMARGHQPGLIVVNRAVGDAFEDYKTPEQEIPDKPLDGPWETCMTMGMSWSFKPYDDYKSVKELIHMLVDVVAKGGNFLLNVGPMPNGKLPPPAVERMQAIGEWLKLNGEAIYGTRPVAPYKEENICLTAKGNCIFALYLDKDCNDDTGAGRLPGTITLKSVTPAEGSDVFLLGCDRSLEWEKVPGGTVIHVPESIAQHPPCGYAYVFRIEAAK